ncbi:helix-turn-helix domain-containing protein [Brevibacillus borstelensis]|uniref:helix-turn-helix domain-containing protein n=1 Tax=Brevibacillus borstelensis TaxID=45462 RepID=UPI0030BC3565
MENRIREIRKKKGLAGTTVSEFLGITPQYYYEIERGKKRLSAEMAAKLSSLFGVTSDYLLGLSTDTSATEATDLADQVDHYPLTRKEEKDIAIKLQQMMDELEGDSTIAFMGEPMDEEDKELLRISLENALRMSKQMAKKKFTPKKYRK